MEFIASDLYIPGVGMDHDPTSSIEKATTPHTSLRITSLPLSSTPLSLHSEVSSVAGVVLLDRMVPPPPHIDNFVLQISTNTFSDISTTHDTNHDHTESIPPSLPNHISLKSFQPNSRQAVSFENDYFIGKIIFVVRTKPLDPYFKHFFEHSKDRMYIIQLQGTFKKPPKKASSLYMGKQGDTLKYI